MESYPIFQDLVECIKEYIEEVTTSKTKTKTKGDNNGY